MPSIVAFYKTLFEPNEQICWGRSTYETKVRPIRYVEPEEQFFVINPLRKSRLDANVTAYRNILVEFDKLDLDKQKQFISDSGLPYSTLVYSGGKSLHAIISLEWPLTSKDAYKALVKRVYDKLGANVDTSTSNPSRFSRAPEAVRDNGAVQTLLEVHERVPLAELLQWLGPPPPAPKLVEFQTTQKLISARALAFIRYGAPAGEWNMCLYTAACDLFRWGYSLEEVFGLLSQATGHLDSRDRATIRSAANSLNRL